ncbi:MAG: hypothetical protein H0X41_01755 [Chitinophagaceae bacterium]|nr:hypothetical protein [Chitinophagaceae bacterium]
MSDKNNNNGKDTDRDVKPARGQESNENWDDTGEKEQDTNVSHPGESSRRINEQTDTSGYGSSQKAERGNVGPLDADFGELPSEKRAGRNNSATGQGID